MNEHDSIQAWFRALDDGDVEAAASLFADHHAIRNAANPRVEGPDAAAGVLGEFFERTAARRFTVHQVAHGTSTSFAHWTASLTFADGALVAGHVVEPFTAEVTGIDTFTFDEHGRFVDVQIIHETTTVALAAAANTKEA